jgi:hypothetical protein
MEQIGTAAAFVLTLMVFSYILGDNFLYRLAVHTFVGLAAAFLAIVTWENVLRGWFESTVLRGVQQNAPEALALGLLPVLLGVLLLFKTSRRIGRFGNLAVAFVVAVGAAVAIAGALTGTLVPLTLSTGNGADGLVNTVIIFIGVISALIYFEALGRRTRSGTIERPLVTQVVGFVGQGFIVITLGALYGAAILTSLTVLTERVGFLLSGG